MRMAVRKHRREKKQLGILILVSAMTFFFCTTTSEAGWLIYHKPEFKGKVIDAETKQPIEGAVVVVTYNKATLGLGTGSMSSVINVRETLTDKNGIFSIPSYTTVIQPFSWEISASIVIFKPGYGAFPKQHKYPPGLSLPAQEIFFSAGIGVERLLEAYVRDWQYEYTTLKTGIVELQKVRTRDERLEALPGHLTEGMEKTPIMNRLIDEEDKALGIK